MPAWHSAGAWPADCCRPANRCQSLPSCGLDLPRLPRASKASHRPTSTCAPPNPPCIRLALSYSFLASSSLKSRTPLCQCRHTLYRPRCRSFGDIDFKEPLHLVTATPDVAQQKLRPGDAFVVLASDGLVSTSALPRCALPPLACWGGKWGGGGGSCYLEGQQIGGS